MDLLRDGRLVVFSASVIAGMAFGSAREADAAWPNARRVLANTCTVRTNTQGSNGTFYSNEYRTGNAGAPTSSLTLICPYIDDSTMLKASIDAIYVDAQSEEVTPTTIYAQVSACVMQYNETSVACGYASDATASGWNSLSLDLRAWRNPTYGSWYPYINAILPGQSYLTGWIAN